LKVFAQVFAQVFDRALFLNWCGSENRHIVLVKGGTEPRVLEHAAGADLRNHEGLQNLRLGLPERSPLLVCRELSRTEYPRKYIGGSTGLLSKTRNDGPYLHNAIEARWLTPRLKTMGLDEKGMGFHAFRRFRKTWLRGKRCREDINNFWMGHKPQTMSGLYSRMDHELELRLQEADTVGVGFTVLAYVLLQSTPKFQ